MSQEHGNTEERKCLPLNLAEREIIERLLREGKNKGEIARTLSRDKSTIKREARRGTVEQMDSELRKKRVYFADVGQRAAEEKREKSGRKSKIVTCRELVKFVEDKVLGAERWSPDAALGYAKANNLYPGQSISTKTFYNWIDDGLVRIKNIDLQLKVRRKPKSPRRERKKKLGKSIEERPESVGTREEFGHWEGDGIVGKGQDGFLISLVERKLGVGFLFNVKSRESCRIVDVLDGLQAQYGAYFTKIFKSFTFDNGPEFSASEAIERDKRTQAYYAHPYSSYERGTNENWNGIVRRFIPKGSSFERLNETDMTRIANYINTLPRKRFGYRTPKDLWEEEIRAIMGTANYKVLPQGRFF